MFQSLWGIIAYPLGFIMRFCYTFANSVLHLPVAYVFAMLFFTIITKILMFPLSLKQQKSTVTMAVYKPMVDEINKKYANDKQKLGEEMQKLQQEYGYSPTAGCLPLLIQFPILFGLIEVIYKPLTYMLTIPKEIITALTNAIPTAAEAAAAAANNRLIENMVLTGVKSDPTAFNNLVVEGFSSDVIAANIDKIVNLNMSIGSINLWETPKFAWAPILIIPLFSVITMLLSSVITMKTSGSAAASGKSQLPMMLMMSGLFAWFSFMYPAGMSLYWGMQNLVTIVQSFILKKFINVDKMRAEMEAEIEAKKKAKKEKKKVKVTDKKGVVIEKDVTPDELARLRLQRAHELDAERYGDVPPASETEKK